MKSLKQMFKTAAATLLTAALCFGAVSPALAAGGLITDTNVIPFEKTIQMDDQVNLPDGINFTYTVTPSAGAPVGAFTIPAVTTESFKNGTPTVDQTTGVKTYKFTQDITVDLSKFLAAGLYTYTVTETDNFGNTETEIMSTTPKTYTVKIRVKNTDDGLAIDEIGVSADNGVNKLANMPFESTFRKITAENNKTKLTVHKDVEGNYGDKTHDFKFTFKITKLAALEATGTKYDLTVNGTKLNQQYGVGDEYTFYLKDDENLTIFGLPVGTEYQIVEDYDNVANASNYSTTVAINGSTAENSKQADGVLADELNNTSPNNVIYTNTAATTPATGLFIDNLPFILLIALGVSGVAVTLISRRRRYQG